MIELFNLLLLQPTINVLVLIQHGLQALNIPGTLGWSIILLTILVKIILWPASKAQISGAKKMSDKMRELKPQLEALRKKHGDDKMAFAQAQQALYKEHGVNPVAGCLPLLIQMILILPLYQSVEAFIKGQEGLERINHFVYLPSWRLNELPDPHFFGLNLATKPWDFMQPGVGYLVLIIPILSILLQFILSKMMMPPSPKVYPSDSKKEVAEKESTEEMMNQMQSQMMYIMPLVLGYIAFTLPVGVSLYFLTLTLVNILQQYQIAGWGGMSSFSPTLFPEKIIEYPKEEKAKVIKKGKTSVRVEYLDSPAPQTKTAKKTKKSK